MSSQNKHKLYKKYLEVIGNLQFTIREIDVIACIIHNRGEKKIANLLSISPRTVSSHVHNIMLKCSLHSKDGVIDFIQKSGKLSYLKQYYISLLVIDTFKRHLDKIKKQINKNNIIWVVYSGEITIQQKPLLSDIEKYFKLANVELCLTSDKKLPYDLNTELEKIEAGDYFIAILNLLKSIIDKEGIDRIIKEFENEYQSIIEEQPLQEIISAPIKSQFHNIPKIKLGIITSLMILGIILFLQLKDNFSNIQEPILARSNFILPHDNILLKRTKINEEIEKKFSGPDNIKTVVLVGTGGSGKTTLARQYARKQNNSIVWEINAENGNTLLYSFEKLAYSLCTNELEKKEINSIQSNENFDEKIKKLELFLAKKARQNPNWLIIYNNLESFDNIQKYFPYNGKLWGNGKVIITTRDSNISTNSYISSNNIIKVGELTKAEKSELFHKIIEDNRNSTLLDIEESKLEKLLDRLPSFPLDVSTAAHYIKREKISYSKYLEYILKPDEKFSSIQEEFLKDIDEYTKTRYKIITTSIKHIINTNSDFQDLLFFITMLDSENIPKDLLISYKDDLTVSKLMYELRRFSLITETIDNKTSITNNFSIHRCTQDIALAYLMKSIPKSKLNKSLKNIAIALDSYMTKELNSCNLDKIRLLIPHIEMFLTHSNIIDRPYYADLYYKLAHAYFDIATYQKAKQLFGLTYNLYRDLYGENDIKTALASARLGVVYRNIGDYKEAKNLLKQAFIVYNRHYGPKTIESGKIAIYLGNAYRNIGDSEKAKELTEKAYRIYKANYKDNDINLSFAMAYLGTIYKDIGEYKKSKKLLEKALLGYKNYYGENHTKTAWVSVRLASLYKNTGNYKQAQKLLEKALNIYQLHNGKDSLETAWTLSHLGIIYHKLGNNTKSVKLLEEGLAIYNMHIKSDDIITGWVKFNLSNAYYAIKNYKKSSELLKESLKIYEKYYGKTHVKTMSIASKVK